MDPGQELLSGLILVVVILIAILVLIVVAVSRYDKRKKQEREEAIQAASRAADLQFKKLNEEKLEKRRAQHKKNWDEFAPVLLHEKLIALDVETQYLSSEIAGGWDAVSEFLVAVTVTWDKVNEFRVWYEKDVPALLEELGKFAQILTFNGDRFDLKVLEHYGSIKELKKKSVDLLAFIKRHTRKRVSLDVLAQENLKIKKSMSGIQAVSLWRSGDPEKQEFVVEYCKSDVRILLNLYVELHAGGLTFPGAGYNTFSIWADGSHDTL